MPTLTAGQIYGVCLEAGFTPDQAVTWTAIALAESGGQTGAHNPVGEDSRGLWQINIDPSVRSNPWGELSDPINNARAAYEVSNQGTDMRPWTVTHARNEGTNKDYRQYMDEARAAAGGAYQGDFSGVSGYDDPSPMGADEPGGVVPAAGPPPAPVPAAPAPEPDADTDGASDAFEMSKGTDPHVADTDQDGLTDGFELGRGLNALAVDTDTDGLSDAYETQIGSDALKIDSDADTESDAYEVASGRDPGVGVAPGAAGADLDSDADGLSDALEASMGSNPLVADSDTDGIADGLEQAKGLDAARYDSDADGIGDAADAAPLTGFVPGPPAATAFPGTAGPGVAPFPGAPLPGVAPFPGAPMPAGAPVPGAPAAGVVPAADPAAMAAGGAQPAAPAPPTAGPGDDVAPGKMQEFLDLALAQTGDEYVFGGEASVDDADPEVFDCSELIQWAGGRVGVEMPDGSWLQYLELQERGAIIPVEEAVNTPGALLFSFDREPTAGGGRPGSAHVAISLGDGTTIEARGRAYGVGTWETGDRFQYAAVIPELGTGTFVPPADGAAAVPVAPPAPPVPQPDTDLDGVGDDFEMSKGLDPARPDTDSDGLTDGFELMSLTNPLAIDTDSDGLSDAYEVQARLDAARADSDADGLTDAYELAALGQPGVAAGLGAVAHPGSGAVSVLDGDGDGLSDAWESTLGTNPLHADTDGDTIADALEVARGEDPVVQDTDDADDDPAQP